MQFVIRQATAGDAAEIARLVNAAYRPGVGHGGWTHESELVEGDRISPAQVTEILRNSLILVGFQGSQLIACVQIEHNGRQAHIGMLAVLPELQAAGVGGAMLTEAEHYAAAHLGAEDLVLVVVSARSELIAYYRRRGYKETGQRLAYPLASGVGIPRSDALDLTVLSKRSNKPLQPTG
ncbi:hypothetical protein CAI21_17535 [Alkalilimnicola ehrlichii]|uniref:N-acetyltransferase domain-containing protein n=1 Tax=Alkalilimnicola ehrlichii TaxID=351052 RepID=A0A3E0WJX8_9GAMM|nr:N-acetyltransferase [Alkalilimnicola ehrlichii]RFA26278.1 hypothetical protein CAI21_17535 [Alkalilimnicola ehrlichii]RFA33264.1 hypothetical protein CAL65_18025 [Alkalilimnicola ehrlichii]